MQHPRSLLVVTAAAVVALAVACAAPEPGSLGGPPDLGSLLRDASTVPTLPPRPHPVVVAAGNVACAPDLATASTAPDRCRDRATFDAALASDPDTVLALGDLQETAGALDAFQSVYDPSWGTLRARTRPVPGVAEYGTERAGGYFDYFGPAAGPYGQGWYSFDLGPWHVVALNTNCDAAGGCGPDSEQGRWLAADLRDHADSRCTLATMNRPRYSSGAAGVSGAEVAPLWDALAAGGADVVLAAHDRHYERFAAMGTGGRPDPAGMFSFVVGTGGTGLTPPGPAAPGSEIRDASSFGVLQLTLLEGGLDHEFRTIDGGEIADRGHLDCH